MPTNKIDILQGLRTWDAWLTRGLYLEADISFQHLLSLLILWTAMFDCFLLLGTRMRQLRNCSLVSCTGRWRPVISREMPGTTLAIPLVDAIYRDRIKSGIYHR